MKKYAFCILLLVLSVGLTACLPANTLNPYTPTGAPPQFPTNSTTGNTQTHTTISTIPTSVPSTIPEPDTIMIHMLGGSVAADATRVHTSVAGMPLEYGWTYHDGRIFLKEYEGAYPVGIIYGSDSYIYASVSSMAGVYHYLINVQSGEVSDPLADLEADIRSRISNVMYSADGSYALVFSHSGTVATLLNCVTGQSTSLPVAEYVYSAYGDFISDSHILLTSCFQRKDGQFYYTFTLYHIATGECTPISGEYQKKDRSQEDFIGISEGGILYTFTDGQLAIIDPLTWQKTVYPFGDDALVAYYTQSTYIVSSEGNRYLLHKNGTYQLIN